MVEEVKFDAPTLHPEDLLEDGSHSWYKRDFVEHKKIGRGGFGQVFKALNKIDSLFYAIKKVPLNSKDKLINEEIMREVMLLSRLQHMNIVRYYNAWIEDAEEKLVCSSDESDEDEE